MRRMRHTILMIASTSFFSDYGNHVRIWEEAQSVQQLGHRLVLATYHNGDDMPGLDTRRSWDVPWIRRAVVGSSRHKLYLDVALSWRALRVALDIRPDILHAHTHEAAAIALPLRALTGAPLVLDYQGSMTSEMLDHGFLSSTSKMLGPLQVLERQINRQADAILPSTHNAAALLLSEGIVNPRRVHAVTDSVNIERFRPSDDTPACEAERQALREQLGIPPGRRIVVYVGLLAPYQGTNMLIQAAQTVVARHPDVHFLIMGHPDPASYRSYAASLGVQDPVTLPGRIIYRDLPGYLALGELAVAPKMSLTEGNGKIGNYMAMGLPVVAFDTPVAREILGECGMYAEYGSVHDLARWIMQALEQPDWARELGRKARGRAVRELSWTRTAHELEAVYNEVLARRRRKLQHSP
jgi:glycosyltransferase involved in cell wall biosynthesis